MVSPRLNRAANICRIIVGLVFAFSGFVKAVDPWGTALKVNEYLSIYGIEQLQPLSMIFSIWLCGAELMMGLMLTFKVRTHGISLCGRCFRGGGFCLAGASGIHCGG